MEFNIFKLKRVLSLLIFVLVLVSCTVFAGSDKNDSGGPSPAIFFSTFLAPLIVIITFSDPKFTARSIVSICNSNAEEEKKRKRISGYLGDDFINSGGLEGLISWRPGKLTKIINEPAQKNQKIVTAKFEDGSTYKFYLKIRDKGEKRKNLYWIVWKIETFSCNP